MRGLKRYLMGSASVGAGERPERGSGRTRSGRLGQLQRGAFERIGARSYADCRRVGLARAIRARVRPERDADREHLLAQLAASLAGRLFAHALADRAARAGLRDGLVARTGQDGARLARAHQTAGGASALHARLPLDRLALVDGLVV